MNHLDVAKSRIPAETLQEFIMLGRKLAAEMAASSFRTMPAASGWTMDHIEAATEVALARMEVSARDALAAKGGDPDGDQWLEIWTAMEACYRETMAGLLKASGHRGGGTLQ